MERSEIPAGNTASSLAAIASHERELLAGLEDAKRDARKRIDDARQEASRRHTQALRDLDAEIARMKQAAEAACEKERVALLEETRVRLEAETASAQGRVDEAVKSVVAMVLPTNTTVR